MKQTQIPPIPPQDKEPDNNNRSPSSLWNLWVDNLKEWHFYLVEEHGHHQRADISGWIDKLRQRIRSFMTSLRRAPEERQPPPEIPGIGLRHRPVLPLCGR